MKNILLLLLIVVGILHLRSQTDDCIMEMNGISTNPGNPVNPQCPSPAFLNTFDWRAMTYSSGINGTNSVTSPFFNTEGVGISYLWNPLAYPVR